MIGISKTYQVHFQNRLHVEIYNFNWMYEKPPWIGPITITQKYINL